MKTDTQIMNEIAIKTGYLKELPKEQSEEVAFGYVQRYFQIM